MLLVGSVTSTKTCKFKQNQCYHGLTDVRFRLLWHPISVLTGGLIVGPANCTPPSAKSKSEKNTQQTKRPILEENTIK